MPKNKGISRRPIEYVLTVVLVVLVCFGFWVYWYTNKTQDDGVAPATESETYVGTIDEVNELAEEVTATEEQLYIETDEIFSSSSDSSADNVAGAYDESEY